MRPQRIFDLAEVKNYTAHPVSAHGLSPGIEMLDFRDGRHKNSIYVLAGFLIRQKIVKGDIIITISTGCVEWNWIDLAVMSLGAIHVTLSPTITIEQLNNILNETRPAFIFLQSGFLVPVLESCPYYQAKRTPVILLKSTVGDAPLKLSAILEHQLTAGEIDCVENARDEVSENDIALISYTSGTGDKLKGVRHSHRSITEHAILIAELYNFSGINNAFSFLPVNYLYERLFNYIYQCANVPIVYASNSLTLARNLKISEAGCCAMVPETLQLLLSSPDNLKIVKPFLRFLFCSGAPLAKSVVDSYRQNGIEIFEHYGSTETLIIALNSPRYYKSGTSGKLLFPERCKYGPGGVLYYKSTFSGYFNNDELNNTKTDSAGYYETGDIVEVDSGQFITIKGRASELFKIKSGVFINPVDIESRVALFCKARYIVVYPDRNQKLKAIIVRESDGEDAIITGSISSYNLGAKSDYILEGLKILPNSWSEETGELTSSQKVKRAFVIKKYGSDE